MPVINHFEEVTQINMIRELKELSLQAINIKRGLLLNDIVNEIFGGEHGIADFTNGQSVLRIRKNPYAD